MAAPDVYTPREVIHALDAVYDECARWLALLVKAHLLAHCSAVLGVLVTLDQVRAQLST